MDYRKRNLNKGLCGTCGENPRRKKLIKGHWRLLTTCPTCGKKDLARKRAKLIPLVSQIPPEVQQTAILGS